MKLKIKTKSLKVTPKQDKGKLSVEKPWFTIQPKPSGVVVKQKDDRNILKSDDEYGVILRQERFTEMLNQTD